MPDLSPTYQLADNLLDGGLAAFVRGRRDEGQSWRRITLALYEATDRRIDVTHETLRSWFPDEVEVAS